MNFDELRTYCEQKIGVQASYPFGEGALVFKVMGKMFALMADDLGEDEPPRISLKCDPTLAQILRETYPAVKPGYHMNKKHWNTITCDGTIPEDEVFEMIDNSYELVVKSLRKKDRATLESMN